MYLHASPGDSNPTSARKFEPLPYRDPVGIILRLPDVCIGLRAAASSVHEITHASGLSDRGEHPPADDHRAAEMLPEQLEKFPFGEDMRVALTLTPYVTLLCEIQ
jgi:hypothetical protein